MTPSAPVSVVLLDLGGVLIRLTGTPVKQAWFPELTSEALWHKWLSSELPRLFETGRISADEFAARLVSEWRLPVSAAAFLDYFRRLPAELYPGVLELLDGLRTEFQLAVLSNSNELHWDNKLQRLGLAGQFDHYFASHQIGIAKPDAAIYEHVIDQLAVEPGQIAFFDDNAINVEAARGAGMHACQVRGPDLIRRTVEAAMTTASADRSR